MSGELFAIEAARPVEDAIRVMSDHDFSQISITRNDLQVRLCDRRRVAAHAWTWVPFAGIVVFLAVGIWRRSWLQRRRYGSAGFLLFRSGRWSQHVRDALALVLSVVLLGQAVVAGLSPASMRTIGTSYPPQSILWQAVGILLLFWGIGFLVAAQLNLGSSWRMGIEEGAKPGLVTSGIYRFSRNPILLAMLITPDTKLGWRTIQQYASGGVPLEVLLHQRLYGGAFRQLLDATSSKRGDVLEDAVAELFTEHEIPFVRTGSHNQEEIARRFSITVRPAPDFVVFDRGETLRAILECKGANDGGTARDKAARFRGLRAEATRLGGVPLFAVLAGLGWTRSSDALGPVIRDTDGRTFTIPTLTQMPTVQPFPALTGTHF